MPHNTLNIYNSAGEVVANVPLPVSVGSGIVSMTMPSSYAPVYDASSGKAQPLTFTVTSSGGTSNGLAWYGVNAQGQAVAGGIYMAELVYYSPGGTKTLIVKSFSVLSVNMAALSGVYAMPNPAERGAALEIMYNAVPSTYGVEARLFNLAGQVVESVRNGSTGPLVFNTNNLASGVYIVSLEMTPSNFVGAISRSNVKVAVIR